MWNDNWNFHTGRFCQKGRSLVEVRVVLYASVRIDAQSVIDARAKCNYQRWLLVAASLKQKSKFARVVRECPICHRRVVDKWCDNRDRYWRISARGTQGGIRHDTAGARQPVRDSANVGCRSHAGRWQDRYTSIMPAPAHSFPPDPKHPDPPNLLTWHALFHGEPHYDTRCRTTLIGAKRRERHRSRSFCKFTLNYFK